MNSIYSTVQTGNDPNSHSRRTQLEILYCCLYDMCSVSLTFLVAIFGGCAIDGISTHVTTTTGKLPEFPIVRADAHARNFIHVSL